MKVAIMTPRELREAEEVDGEERVRRGEEISLADEDESFTNALGAQIQRDWIRARDNKVIVDQEILNCLRDRKGEYAPEDLVQIQMTGASDIYLKIATSKIRAAIAHIKPVLLPVGEKAHGIEPTSDPQLPEFIEQRIIERIMSNPNMVDAQGNPVELGDQLDKLMTMAQKEMRSHASRAAKKMMRKIDDQLEEGGWRRALSDFIDDFCTYPAAFLYGPYISMEPTLNYEMTPRGSKLASSVKPVMRFKTINPTDAYPAPGSDSVQKGPFIYRLRTTKKELYRMRNVDGYSSETITKVMSEEIHGGLNDWLWMDSARDTIANHSFFWYKSTTEIDGLHWFGSTQGIDLLQWGMDPDLICDPLEFYEVDAIKIGRHVVKATINPDPKYRRPVHSSSYERIPGNVFGNAPATLMRPTGRMINATARALQNNQALASGFQAEVNHRRVAPETDIHNIFPNKVWQTTESEQATNGAPAIRFFQPQSNATELMNTLNYFLQLADNDTGIPAVLQGGPGDSSGADGTAKGRGYLMSSAAKLLRSSIGNIDEDVIVPALQMMYDFNMLYDPDESIKGDAKIVARGANEMLQRETARQEHMAMLEISNNPQDAAIIGLRGRAHLLRKTLNTFENIDADQVIPDGDELEERLTALENQQPPPDPNLLKVQSDAQYQQGLLANEQQKLQVEQQLQQEKIRAERILKTMEMSTREKVSRDDLAKKLQNEIIKLRATRMSERERMQMDVKLARMKVEAEARAQVAKMKEAQRQRDHQGRVIDGSKGVTDVDIANIVRSITQPLMEVLADQTGETMDRITGMLQAEERVQQPQPVNVTVTIPKQSRQFEFNKNPDGTISGSVSTDGVTEEYNIDPNGVEE